MFYNKNHVIQFCGFGLLTFFKLLLFLNVDFAATTSPPTYHLNCSADIERFTANNKSFAYITLDEPFLTPSLSDVTVRLLSNATDFSIGVHEVVYAAFDTNEKRVANCSVWVFIHGKLIYFALLTVTFT